MRLPCKPYDDRTYLPRSVEPRTYLHPRAQTLLEPCAYIRSRRCELSPPFRITLSLLTRHLHSNWQLRWSDRTVMTALHNSVQYFFFSSKFAYTFLVLIGMGDDHL
ncbi:hypothetical protein GALMADRAFT_270825 [Galerina marginata CBS 339.88]|uniref:Uncharacterized protein n=1 Tax=Galerina marginata (strain CBS 339.88) TaxID=685588 RepID=A0A067SM88_GALM3|nr:hypothetical protein GALMADRAFT_270825 [Galerina marginata CBS 339.88]